MAYQSKYDGDTIQNAIANVIEGKFVKSVGQVAPTGDSGNVTISVENLNWGSDDTEAAWLRNKISFNDNVNTLIESKNYVTADTAPVQSVNKILPVNGNITIATGITEIVENGSPLTVSSGSVDIGNVVSGITMQGTTYTSGNVEITPNSIGALSSEDVEIPVAPTGSYSPKMDGNVAYIGDEPEGSESEHFARWDHIHEHDNTKVDIVTGYGLSKNDFTDTLLTKLNGIESGAMVNFYPVAHSDIILYEESLADYGVVRTDSTITDETPGFSDDYIQCPIVNGIPYYGDASKGIKIDGTAYSKGSDGYVSLPLGTTLLRGVVKLGADASSAGGDGIAASQTSLQSVNSSLNSVSGTVTNLINGNQVAKRVESQQQNGYTIRLVGVGEANGYLYYNSNVYISNSVLMGGAWNDYAESRDSVEDPSWLTGRCVKEVGNGQVSVTTDYLDCCAGVVSDTYGMLIGADYENKCPIAVTGRVLVYPETEPEDFEIDDVVCAAPDGCVRKMTREEIREWPERIVGVVSEIPQYEKWNDVEVNGRIWIKVK